MKTKNLSSGICGNWGKTPAARQATTNNDKEEQATTSTNKYQETKTSNTWSHFGFIFDFLLIFCNSRLRKVYYSETRLDSMFDDSGMDFD